MFNHPPLYYYLWIAPHVLQVVLAGLMIRQRLVREFPAFFAYTIFEIFQFFILLLLGMGGEPFLNQYSYAWYGGELLSAALRFVVIREIFGKVFADYSSLRHWANSLFCWATVVFMIASVVIVALTPGSQTERLSIATNVIDRTVDMVQCGLLLLLVGLSRFLRFNWRSYVFGIAFGLGIFAGLKLVDWELSAKVLSPKTEDLFAMFLMAAYHCCVLFWVVTLLLPKPQSIPVSVMCPSTLDRWNDTLERFLQS